MCRSLALTTFFAFAALVPAIPVSADPAPLPLLEELQTQAPAGHIPITASGGGVELVKALKISDIAPSGAAPNDLWIDTHLPTHPVLCLFHPSLGWLKLDGSGEPCGPPVVLHELSLVAIGSGDGLVQSDPPGIACGSDCTEPFVAGEPVTLEAIANPGALFLGWSGDCTGTANPLTLVVDQELECYAEFGATSGGSPAPDWSVQYELYYDFDEVLAAGTSASAKVVLNQGSAGAACDLRQYGSDLPVLGQSLHRQQGTGALRLASVGASGNQRVGVRMAADLVNGSCEIARTGNSGPDYGSFSYHIRFRPELNDTGTISRVSEVANSGPGGWALEWGESAGTVTGRFYNGSVMTTILSANGVCPAGSWCVVSLTYHEPTDQACLVVNGGVAGCLTVANLTEPLAGTNHYYRFGYATSAAKLDGYLDETGLVLGKAYDASQACRVCACGIDGSLCTCDAASPSQYQAGGGDGLHLACGNCPLPACDGSAP